MSKSVNLNIPIDGELQKKVEKIFSNYGIGLEEAIVLFVEECAEDENAPLRLLEIPNRETLEAIKEATDISHDKTAKTYTHFSELLDEVRNEI